MMPLLTAARTLETFEEALKENEMLREMTRRSRKKSLKSRIRRV